MNTRYYILIFIICLVLIYIYNNKNNLETLQQNILNNSTTFVPCDNNIPPDDIYIDNPYDLFYDPNYTTLFYDPTVTYQLNTTNGFGKINECNNNCSKDSYGGTWSLGGSRFYPYHHTYIKTCNPIKIISGDKFTYYGGNNR
jgi:hypothetical protein